jgi:TonB family protein
MSAPYRRGRTLLAYGFAISIAVHAVAISLYRPQLGIAKEEPPPDILYRDAIPTPPPTPRPTATPKPTPVPTPPQRANHTPAPARRPLRIAPPHQASEPHGGTAEAPYAPHGGDPNGAPGPAGSGPPAANDPAATPAPPAPAPTPSPRPTPTPLSCARPNVPATTLRALEPETPSLAAQQGISGVVNVVVSLDAQSRVVAARVQSSPSAVLNAAALAAARGSQFRTEVRNCEPVAADYLFSVEFPAQ